MKSMLSRSLSVAVCVSMAGCSLFGTKKTTAEDATYGSGSNNSSAAAVSQKLAVPPDLITPSRDPRFVDPDVGKATTTYSAYTKGVAATPKAQEAAAAAATPSAEAVIPNFSKVRVERAGSQRWLVVPGTPDQVWQQLRQFWADNGFDIKIDKPNEGIMETEWAENHAKLPMGTIQGFLSNVAGFVYSTGELDKFRTRIEKSSQDGMVEVYISHRGLEEMVQDTGTKWKPRPIDPDLEVQFMRRFALRFGVDKQALKQVVPDDAAANAPGSVQLAHAFLVDGGQRLEVDGALDKVWRQVGLALDRTGVVVEDRDRSANTYYVRYLDTREDPQIGKSWFSKLAFWNKKEVGTDQFRVVLTAPSKTTVSISILDRTGKPVTGDTGNEILKLLFDELK